MMDNYEKIRQMCLRNNISKGKTSDHYIFTLNAVDYFYFGRNMGEIDIRDSFTDGANDGGIDYVHVSDDVLYLIQGKSSTSIDIEEIRNIFNKMINTIDNFEHTNTDEYSAKLQSVYKNAYDLLSDDKNITLVLFTNSKINDNLKDKIISMKQKEPFNNYKIAIYDSEDIELKETMSFQEKPTVDYGIIELNEAKNTLSYNENGIIVNILASSLKELYKKNINNGLFSFNLREHISQKNVDTAIDKTIKEDKDNFWFYNNGITIGCDDFTLDGNKIKIYNFSIINGAQTTTLIGKSKLITPKYDFPLVCKIVKAGNSMMNEIDFISRISEASNSQKPIKFRDLKANAIEQKKLQTQSAQNGKYSLAIEIKRGVKAENYNSVRDSWKRVTNEYIGQLILSCILQKPGTARSGKSLIFSSDKVYNSVYIRTHDYNTIFDLVRIANIYENFRIEFSDKNSEEYDLIAVAKNGKYVVLGILFYFFKKINNIVEKPSDEKLQEDNITGNLTLDYDGDDFHEKLFTLFEYIINKLNDVYKIKQSSLKLTSYSNFFKTDLTYIEEILPEFERLFNGWDQKHIIEYMEIFLKEKVVTN